VTPSDLLEFYLADDQTKVIGFYIETAKDGRRLFEMLRAAKAKKPVVILKGGPHGPGSRLPRLRTRVRSRETIVRGSRCRAKPVACSSIRSINSSTRC
jgi:hypothetical protein